MSEIIGRCYHDENNKFLALKVDDYKEINLKYQLLKKLFKYYVRLQYNTYIAGGAARWILSPAELTAFPEDIDIWLPFAIDSGWIYRFKKQIFPVELRDKIKVLERKPTKGEVTNKIVTFICQPYHCNIQIMTCCSAIEEILASFDFSVCRAAITKNDLETSTFQYKAIVDENFMEDEMKQKIRICTPIDKDIIWRIYKYYKKGYSLELEDLVNLTGYIPEMSLKEEALAHAVTARSRNEETLLGPILKALYEKYWERVCNIPIPLHSVKSNIF